MPALRLIRFIPVLSIAYWLTLRVVAGANKVAGGRDDTPEKVDQNNREVIEGIYNSKLLPFSTMEKDIRSVARLGGPLVGAAVDRLDSSLGDYARDTQDNLVSAIGTKQNEITNVVAGVLKNISGSTRKLPVAAQSIADQVNAGPNTRRETAVLRSRIQPLFARLLGR